MSFNCWLVSRSVGRYVCIITKNNILTENHNVFRLSINKSVNFHRCHCLILLQIQRTLLRLFVTRVWALRKPNEHKRQFLHLFIRLFVCVNVCLSCNIITKKKTCTSTNGNFPTCVNICLSVCMYIYIYMFYNIHYCKKKTDNNSLICIDVYLFCNVTTKKRN